MNWFIGLVSQFFSSELHLRPVPLHCQLQALFEVDAWFVAKVFLGFRDIGEGVFNITSTFWPVLWAAAVAGKFLEDSERIVEGRAATRSHVEHTTDDLFCRRLAG